MPETFEANFDALPGPTHNYAGLSPGNLASRRSRASISHPRAAAIQALEKMKLLADLGIRQGIIPPQIRPDMSMLRNLGFSGTDAQVLNAAHRAEPELLAACWSASSMWAANAATVSPSTDTGDHKIHFTPANLITQFHRSLETRHTSAALRAIFHHDRFFTHHPPLPAAMRFADEGAANHVRLFARIDDPGIELFVYGTDRCEEQSPSRYPARQTRQASAAIARLHRLDPARTLFARQNPAAIDAGVFHNDVICTGNRDVLLYHEQSFVDTPSTVQELRSAFIQCCSAQLRAYCVPTRQIPLADAVTSYLFNSQLIDRPDGSMILIAPIECREFPNIQDYLASLCEADGPIQAIRYVDLRQSMSNGGGPACVRLRVVLREAERSGVHPGIWLNDNRYAKLTAIINKHYREQLTPDDLRDINLLHESRAAVEELLRELQLQSIYS